MLDVTGILFSSTMMLVVIMRAVQLDRFMPWFQILARRTESKEASGRTAPWRRRG